jgi:RNA polymerase sigma factor (sigma-70 family)
MPAHVVIVVGVDVVHVSMAPGANMTDEGAKSVTRWIRDLTTDDRDEALRRLWERYFPRLVRLAEARLRGTTRGPAGGEDVAPSAFESFFRGAAAGRFPKLASRDDLWKLLVTITARKARNRQRDEHRQKRGGGRIISQTALAACDRADDDILFEVVSREPTPEFAAILTEQFQRLFALLTDESHRVVALLKLEGHTNKEIAASLDCGLRSVERKLTVIRKRWLSEETR